MTWTVELGRGGLSGSSPSVGWWQGGGHIALAALAFAGALSAIRSCQRSI